MVHLRVQGGKAAEMPEVPVFRHLVKISRPAQPVQYADVEGCLTFPELECLQHLPVSGEVGGHVALHGRLASPQDVRPEEFRPGGDETAPVIRGEHTATLPRLFHQPCVVRAEIIDAQFVGIPVYRAEEVVRIILEIALRPLQSPACVIEEQHALSGLYSREYTVAGILLAAPMEVVVGFQQPARPPVVECPFKLADNKVPAVGPPVGVGRLMDKSDIPQPLVVVGGPRASVDYIPHKGFHPVLIPIGGLDAVDPFLGQVGPFQLFPDLAEAELPEPAVQVICVRRQHPAVFQVVPAVQYESDIHGGTVLIYNFLPEGFRPVLFLFSGNSSHCPAG